MEQLLLHLFGDYVTQTDKMAREKTRSHFYAFIHASVYAPPFVLLNPSMTALAVIWLSHYLIDRYRLARFLIYAKNWLHEPSLRWKDCNNSGYPKDKPQFLAVWLMIITDNFMHLSINWAALRWL